MKILAGWYKMTAIEEFNGLVEKARLQKVQAKQDAENISEQLKIAAVKMMAEGRLQTWGEIWQLVTRLQTSKEGRRKMLMDARELYLDRMVRHG
jgi:hypothetical protein